MDPSLIYIETRRFKDLPKTSEMTRIVLTAVEINTTPSNGYIKVFYDEHCTTLLKGESFSINKTSIPAIKYELFASNNTKLGDRVLNIHELLYFYDFETISYKPKFVLNYQHSFEDSQNTISIELVLSDKDKEKIIRYKRKSYKQKIYNKHSSCCEGPLDVLNFFKNIFD